MAGRIGKRFTGLLGRAKTVTGQSGTSTSATNEYDFDNAPTGSLGSPEANVTRSVRLFCESGSMSNGGEEVLHLPAIVEAAESSPTAAAAAALQIRKFLSRDWALKPHVQYNAIMLIRILSDNPGPSFSKNFDKTFVSTVKEALRMCRDPSTQQLLRETLDSLEANKQYQEGMEGLIQMWRKEKGHQNSLGGSRNMGPPPSNEYLYSNPTYQQDRQRSGAKYNQLPPPMELASRVEEARNTAKILLQLIQSTPAEEVLHNELIKEFSDRCQGAQRSMQSYINCQNPPPDDDTMLTLIETNEQLSLATSRYQRSALTARRAMGAAPSPNAEAMQKGKLPVDSPTAPLPQQGHSLFAPNSPSQQSPEMSAFANAKDFAPRPDANASANRQGGYEPPPGPPAAMLARLNSRENQSPPSSPIARLSSPEKASDPFADPDGLPQDADPSATDFNIERNPAVSQLYANDPPSRSFNVDAGPTYAPQHDLTAADASPMQVPPKSPHRPSPGAWHNSDITPSYIGRQTNAINGLSMTGAQARVPEIDGHSEVGRTDSFGTSHRDMNATADDGMSSAYSGSPVQTRGDEDGYGH